MSLGAGGGVKQLGWALQALVLALLGVNNTQSEDLAVAFGTNRPPFVYQNKGQWVGFEIDITKKALGLKGHGIKSSSFFANKRLGIAVSQMNFDVGVTVQYQNDGTFYSDDFISYHNYAISKKRNKVKIQSIQDLTRYSPVAWQNAYTNLGEEFALYFGPTAKGKYLENYLEFVNQDNQNHYFWVDRADVIIIDKTIFLWHRKRLAGQLNTQQALVFHDIFDKATHFKVNFKDPAIRDDFNEALKQLKASGEYQTIIDQYLHMPEVE